MFRPNPQRDWFAINDKSGETADGASVAHVEIYDEIGFWGTTAESFNRKLKMLEADELDVRINSTGGDAFAGISIMNQLRAWDGPVTVTVDGIAASAASVIAMGGDTIIMSRGAQMMIHDAASFAFGDAAEMTKMIEFLDVVSDSIADVYAAKAGGTREQWRAVMKTEQWYRAEEAVAAGLADKEDKDDEVEISNHRFAIFNYAGRDEAPSPWIPPKDDAVDVQAEPGKPKETERKEDTMSDALKNGIRERLGMTAALAEISDDMFLAALDEALEETGNSTDPHLRIEAGTQLPAGTQAVDSDVLAQLQADAAAGREALEAQKQAARVARVDAAIQAGKITPARREHWLNALTVDEEGAAEALDSLAPGLVPVAAIGVDSDPDMTEDDKTYAALYGTKEDN